MTDWDKLVKVALLGTRREPLVQDFDDSPPARLLAQLKEGGPAHRLLCTAGTTAIYEQVGRAPDRSMRETAVPQLPADARLPCDARAAYYLSQILGGPYRNLLPEFLTALHRSGQRVPDTLIPNLLAHGAKVVVDRRFILPLLSARDRHLAAQNPAWSYASPAMDSWSGLRRIWDDLAPVKRQSLIKQLRATAPDQGRELVESTWKVDPDNQRIRLLKALEKRLSLNDEPFLETALDDRSQQIRLQAAELLAYIPQSRLCQRMINRVDRFLLWTPEKEQQIAVRFPAIDPAMVRDGVVGSKSKNIARVRAQHLIQIVGAVPLSYWTAAWPESPRQILQAIITTNWTRTLFAGFSWAAYRQEDALWAKEILAVRGLEASTSKLLNLLTSDDYVQLLERVLDEEEEFDPLNRRSPLMTALRRWTHPYDARATQLLLPLFVNHFNKDQEKRTPGSLIRSSFLNLARTCPPDLYQYAAAILTPISENSPQWRPTILDFLHIMHFRRGMLEALRSEQ